MPGYPRMTSQAADGPGWAREGRLVDTDSTEASDAIRVMICDDHALCRRGLIMVLDSEEGMDVVGEAEDGEEAIKKAEELAPDVVLMDVRMPNVSGIEATRRIAEVDPSAKILM